MNLRLNVYDLEIQLIEPLLGTVPKDPDVYTRHILHKTDGKGQMAVLPGTEKAQEELETVPEADDDLEKAGWTGFHTDDEGIFLYNYAILGYLKEAGNVLKAQLGIAMLRDKIDQFVFVDPRRVRILGPDGKPKMKPDGYIERPLRAMTMRGPRVTVVRSDYVDAGAILRCRLQVIAGQKSVKGGIPKDEIDEAVLRILLDYGRFKGLGQFRNGSYGRFRARLSPVEIWDDNRLGVVRSSA